MAAISKMATTTFMCISMYHLQVCIVNSANCGGRAASCLKRKMAPHDGRNDIAREARLGDRREAFSVYAGTFLKDNGFGLSTIPKRLILVELVR